MSENKPVIDGPTVHLSIQALDATLIPKRRTVTLTKKFGPTNRVNHQLVN